MMMGSMNICRLALYSQCVQVLPRNVCFLSNSTNSEKHLAKQLISRKYSFSHAKLNATKSASVYGKAKKPDGIPPGGWFLLVIPISTLALGIWQVCRWRWKLGLIEEMRMKSIADPLSLPTSMNEIENLEYQKVRASGEFDYSNELLIGPRSLVNFADRSPERSRGVFSSGSSNNGYLIITPFKLNDRDETILINRGWVESRNIKKFKHLEGPVEIVGIVRKTENRSPFMSKNKPGVNLLHYRDVPTMAEVLNTGEVFLDLFSIEGVDFSKARAESIPVPRQTRVTLRNEHVSYFVTWFSLSAITSLMWHRRFLRRLNLL